tara:strand:- start:17335 stop:23010 length:5676 start_codon:yes stop_codon:yes gene_type:complete
MPTQYDAIATGSIAFLGAARFRGYWDATKNFGTGSGVDGEYGGPLAGLFQTGSSTRASGYSADVTYPLTAAAGDYWQVTSSGTHNVEGYTSWNYNDWVIYSGSAGAAGTWVKLSFEDTIGSIVLGSLSSSSFHMGYENDKHVIFAKNNVHSGSSNFVYNYTNDRVGIGSATPAYKLDVVGNIVGGTSANSHGHVSVRRDGSIVGGMNTQGGVFNLHGSSTATDTHLTVRSTGKIGIGTVDPISDLEIRSGLTTTGAVLTLATKEPTVVANDVLGRINFYAPLDTGTDSDEIGASIAAIAQATFSDTVNSTALVFQTGKSEAATTKMVIDEDGYVGIGVSDPDSLLEVYGASTQLKLSYDGSNASTLAVASDGGLTITSGDGEVILAGASPKLTIGDAGAEDTMLVFDGNEQDYRIGLDDGDNTLEIGHGSAHGTNTAIVVNSSGQVTKLNLAAAAVAVADDHLVILDGSATGVPKAESVSDLVTAIAGTASATGLSASSGVLSVSDLHPVGVDGAANQLLTDDGDGTVTSESTLTYSAGDLTVKNTSGSGTSSANGAYLILVQDDNAPITSTHNIGAISFRASEDSSNTISEGARISAHAAQTWDGNENDAYLSFSTTNGETIAERMRILDTGLVGIGNPYPSYMLEVSNTESSSDASRPTIEISSWSDATDGASGAGRLLFQKVANDTINTFGAGSHTAAGEVIGEIAAWGVTNDGDGSSDEAKLAAYIQFAGDAVAREGAVPSKIVFATTHDADNHVPTVRLTIDDDGLATFTGDIKMESAGTDPELTITDRSASGGSSGGFIRLASDDTAAMADDDRLGVIEFAGAEDGSGTITVGARIEAICDAGWSASENGAALVMYTTDADASQSEVLRLDSNKLATFAGAVTISGGTLTFDSVGVTAIQTSGESFADNNTSLMTSAAIQDKIEALITAEDLDVTADSGTIDIDLNSETLSIVGTSNEVNTSATGTTVTIGLPNDVTLTGDLTVSGGDVTYGNGQNATLGVTATAAGTAGKSLTITSGGVTAGSGTANRTGGDLVLSSGAATGTGTSSIQFKTAVAGSSGTAAATPAERMRIHTDGNVGIGDSAPGTLLQLKGADAYLTLQNSTSENSAGGCETKIIFEDHGNNALGQIEVSHVGSSDDEKGQLILKTNNDSGLQTALTISEAQLVTFAGGFAVGSDASGDILYYNGTKYVRLAKGSDGQVLKLASGIPSWASGGGGAVSAVANGSDDRIATFSSSDALNGEAQLTFDGSTLNVGTSGDGADLVLHSATAAHVGITWDHDGETEGILIGGADNHGIDFKFYGESAGNHIHWDMSADSLIVTGDATDAIKCVGGFNLDGKATIDPGAADADGVVITHTYTDTSAATIKALDINFDKTGNTTSNNTIYGLFLDMDNTSATNGTNTMIGASITPTLTHDADAGTAAVTGAIITATAGTNGAGTATGMEITATGGDNNLGLVLKCADGGDDLTIQSSADADDLFKIQVGAAGATTITTVDDGGHAADLTFTIDGAIKLDGDGVEIENDSDSGAPALLIDNDDPDAIALDIDAGNEDANVVDITADALTSSNVINISADGLTTGKGISLASTSNNLNGAVLLDINGSGTSTDDYTIVKITKDASNASDSNAIVGLDIDFDGTDGTAARAFRIDSEQTDGIILELNGDALTTGTAIDVSADALTSGKVINLTCTNNSLNGGNLIYAEYDGTSTNLQQIVKIVNDNGSATKTVPLDIQQDSAWPALAIRANGPIITTQVLNQVNTDGNHTITVAQLIYAALARGTNGALSGTRTDITPTAAQIVAAIPGCVNNQIFTFKYCNFDFDTGGGDGANNIVLDLGTGVTDPQGQAATTYTLTPGQARNFLFRVTNAASSSEAVQIVPDGPAYTITS